MRRNSFQLWFWLASAGLAGCSGSSGTTDPVPVRLSLATEPPATAAIGTALTPPPQIQVVDAAGTAVSARGVLVTASVASGAGSLSGTTEVRTSVDGRASFTDLALVGPVGTRTIRFSAQGLSAAISRTIDAAAGPVSAATAHTGNNQTAPAGSTLPIAPAVRVTDASNNPIADVTVTFAVTAGGGSITGQNAVTNSQGVATVGQWVLGTGIGLNRLTATIDGLGTPVTFSATAVIGTATLITLLEGDDQTATIGGAVPIAPVVKVTDGAGNVIVGLGVNFIPSGGGSVTGSPAVTDVDGIARLGGWRIGLVPGSQTLNATRDGGSATFSATATHFPVSTITAGVAHSCAVGADGVVRCWGGNAQGQLGNGTTAGDSMPVTVVGNAQFSQLVAGSHSCGLTPAGVAQCWGANGSGQLGDGGGSNRSSPANVAGGLVFSQLSAGFLHTCGLVGAGVAYCWGAGGNGRLGNGGASNHGTPTPVSGEHQFLVISAGAGHTCGVRTDGQALCWGQNPEGRIGDDTVGDKLEPTLVTASASFTTITAGGGHTCALDGAGKAWCWGANSSGQLGDASLSSRMVPVPVAMAVDRRFTAITAGTAHTCALDTEGAAWCWGENSTGGRLGDGTFTDRTAPTPIAGGVSYTEIRAGDQHTCARSVAGSAICWGANATGQLGDGTRTGVNRPAGVKAP